MQTLQTKIDTPEDITKVFKVMGDRICVMRDTMQKFTEGGIEIPGNSKEFKPHSGVVLSSGARSRGVSREEHIMFGRGSGTEVTINEVTFLVMRDSDILLNMRTLKPWGDKVLIEPKDAPKNVGSIFVPDNALEQPQTGVVFKIGDDCEEAKEGQSVLFGKYAGFRVDIKGKEYLIIREKDIFSEI